MVYHEKVRALSFQETVERGININHPFLDYISSKDKQEIIYEIMNSQSFIIGFERNFMLAAVAIFTVYNDKVHIREIGGDYVWATKHVNQYAEIIAKKIGLNKVSFTAVNEIIKKRSKIYGYEPSKQYQNEFERMV